MLCHASSLIWFPLIAIGFPLPFLSIVAPLIVWLTKRKEHTLIDAHGKESLNFQISLLMYAIACAAFVGLLALIGNQMNLDSTSFIAIGWLLVFLALALVSLFGIIQLIFVIIAAVKANEGNFYRYPFIIRFLK